MLVVCAGVAEVVMGGVLLLVLLVMLALSVLVLLTVLLLLMLLEGLDEVEEEVCVGVGNIISGI